jgi:hypothetical protein
VLATSYGWTQQDVLKLTVVERETYVRLAIAKHKRDEAAKAVKKG